MTSDDNDLLATATAYLDATDRDLRYMRWIENLVAVAAFAAAMALFFLALHLELPV